MFERFASEFAGQAVPADSDPWLDDYLVGVAGYVDFSKEWAGTTFEQGLYRIVDAANGSQLVGLIAAAFPDFIVRTHPFAYDWLGRAFAIDAGRLDSGQPMVLMLEPGTGKALEIPHSFVAFHEELSELREPALAAGFFARWAQANADALPLRPSFCVGYKVPLFLGGNDTLENLELVDIDVYWSICGQLHMGIRDHAPGTTIRDVHS